MHTLQPAYIYKFFGESAKDSECTSATDCDALYGIVSLSKTWNKGVLKVYFMNEAVLRGWRCGSNAMTTKKILAWAKGAWNNQSLQGVPKFVETRSEDKDDQDIRVYFTGGFFFCFCFFALHIASYSNQYCKDKIAWICMYMT